MRRVAPVVVVVLVASLLGPHAPAATSGSACLEGDPQRAATTLISEHARVESLDRVGGFTSALVADPVFVGHDVTHRLVFAAGRWCAAAGFDEAWRMSGRRGTAVERASSFAVVAGAAWFGEVTVREARVLLPGVVRLVTHGSRNGVVATWTVETDSEGIRSASWRATDFAVPPFVPEVGGLSALPGAGRTFTRAGGVLRLDGPLAPQSSGDLVELMAEATFDDGFTIRVRNGETPLGVVVNMQTGVQPVDVMKLARDTAVDNYEEFRSWGLEGRWEYRFGTVYIDDSLSLFCFACVLISDVFNIHMSSQVVHILGALGFTYPDHDDAFSNVMGHEMFHNFQLGYWRAAGLRAVGSAMSEGTARFQETLHSYSQVSHQPNSLVLGDGGWLLRGNTCNDYLKRQGDIDGSYDQDESAALRLRSHSYDACLFFLSWYADHGVAGVVALLEAGISPAPTDFYELLEAATGPIGEHVTAFAARVLTGGAFEWGPASGGGPVLDWGTYVEPWEPAVPTDGRVTRGLEGGGMAAVPVLTGGVAVATSDADDTVFSVVREAPDGEVAIGSVSDGQFVAGPATGERVWLVAVGVSWAEVTLGLD